ncbi:hypothetical protein BKA63DRAFT_497713 [Paraphoma chrysanthemicola]|nr:hypothetical protein BKA63DRAFT_497713 [Paraphoma chrysanthemicola]
MLPILASKSNLERVQSASLLRTSSARKPPFLRPHATLPDTSNAQDVLAPSAGESYSNVNDEMGSLICAVTDTSTDPVHASSTPRELSSVGNRVEKDRPHRTDEGVEGRSRPLFILRTPSSVKAGTSKITAQEYSLFISPSHPRTSTAQGSCSPVSEDILIFPLNSAGSADESSSSSRSTGSSTSSSPCHWQAALSTSTLADLVSVSISVEVHGLLTMPNNQPTPNNNTTPSNSAQGSGTHGVNGVTNHSNNEPQTRPSAGPVISAANVTRNMSEEDKTRFGVGR